MNTQKLFHRNFTMVVIGQIISLFGNAILRFALPLYLLDQTASPGLVGLAGALAFLPMALLSPIGGVVADRVNKRNVMVALDFSTAALIVVFSLALGRVQLVPLLIAVMMILYGIQGAYQPAVQASLPLLASADNLMPANAVINQVSALSGLLGPAVGGILYGGWGLRPILLMGIACFVLSAVMEIFIRIPHTPRPTTQGVFAIVRGDLRESMRFIVKEQPVMAKAVGLLCAFNLFLSALLILGIMVIIKQTLGLSDQMYGLSQGLLAAGGLCGGVLAGVFAKKLRISRAHWLLFACAALLLPISLTLGLGAPPLVSFWVITGASFALMALATLFSVQMLTFVQMRTPEALVGKVIACLMAVSMCAQPVGQALYGILFEQFGAFPWAIVLGAAAVSAGIAILSRKVFCSLEG